jgi:deazaflavin-dependent oxidoreductase (nitroreductase family)
MSTPAQVVEQFLDHLNAQRIDDGMDLLTEDVFYHNIPMDPMTGREAVRQSAHEFGMGSTLHVEWQLVSLAAADDVVLTERIDIFTAADGKQISMPLMGSFRIRDGYIAEWRDYFDLSELQRQMAAMGMTEDELSDGDDTGPANDVDYAQFNVPIIEEFRANSGKVTGTFEGVDIALITSTGAKSGLPRVSPLVYVTDAGQLVVAATAAGSPKNPGWYFNLVADPEVTVEVGVDQYRARAVEVKGYERDRLFAKVVQSHPRLGSYESKTDRTVPVFVLEPIE